MVGYLLLGLCVIGGLAYALMQLSARTNRLNAEMLRLERLAAEVTMSAEAVLEQVDLRMDKLLAMVKETETKLAQAQAQAQAAAPALPTDSSAATPTPAATPAASQPAAAAPPAPAAPAVTESPALEEPTSIERYQRIRNAVCALADQGKTTVEIARQLGVLRGEVQLILNLRGKKFTA